MDLGGEPREIKHCYKCKGLLKTDTIVHIPTGVVIQQFVCVVCGRQWPAGVKVRPAIAA